MTERAERRRYLDVAGYVLRAVAAGTITRGDRLPSERELGSRCGVSRSSVREALLALELGGVIEGRPGSGWYLTGVGVPASTPVSPPLDSSPRELLEVRRIIEPSAAHACAWRIEPQDVRRLATLIDDAERVSAEPPGDDLHPFVRLNLAFHRELAQLCGNAILASMTGHLVDANEHPLWLLVDSIVVRSPATRAAQVKEHRTILTAIAEHRGQDAAQAMSVHLGALTKRIFGTTSGRPHQLATKLV
jgi:DNA-binding FadR family transcriptional regulator